MSAPFERIVLLKLRPDSAQPEARETLARALSALLGARASIGLPADSAAEKSWDVSIVVGFDDLVAATSFDVAEALRAAVGRDAAGVVEVSKGWAFRTV